MGRFDYVQYDGQATIDQVEFKNKFVELEKEVVQRLQPGRATSLVFTKLEEAYMWIGKAIRDDQIARDGEAKLQEERNNS